MKFNLDMALNLHLMRKLLVS